MDIELRASTTARGLESKDIRPSIYQHELSYLSAVDDCRIFKQLLVAHLRMTDGTNDRALVEEEKDFQSSGDEKDQSAAQSGSTQSQSRQRIKMLPEITPELIKEHEAQLRASGGGVPRGNGASNGLDLESPSCCHIFCPCHQEDENGEPAAICGIPYYLFMILAALAAAVAAGTVLAVVYYDPNSHQSPTQAPTMTPTSLGLQSDQPTLP